MLVFGRNIELFKWGASEKLGTMIQYSTPYRPQSLANILSSPRVRSIRNFRLNADHRTPNKPLRCGSTVALDLCTTHGATTYWQVCYGWRCTFESKYMFHGCRFSEDVRYSQHNRPANKLSRKRAPPKVRLCLVMSRAICWLVYVATPFMNGGNVRGCG